MSIKLGVDLPIKIKVQGKGTVYKKDGTIKQADNTPATESESKSDSNSQENVNGNVDNRRS